MSQTVVFQRVVAHYRLPIFERLYREFGWIVATSRSAPEYKKLVHEDYDFIRRFDIQFPNKDNPFEAKVPIRQIIEETKATAVISEFGLRMNSTYELPWIRRTRGKPIVLFWSHGFNMERGFASAKQKLIQSPRVVLSRLIDGHLCYSDEGRDFLARFIPRERLFVAPNTIDVGSLHIAAQEVAPAPAPGRPHLIAVGRLTPDKEIPRLVRLFLGLKAHIPGAGLTIIGDGPDADKVRAAAGLELGKSVIMTGAEYDETKLAAYYHSADVAVFSGAVGLSVNHALAYGVPVVAFARTPEGPYHHPEIAYVVDGVTGRRVPTYSDEAMIEALREFLGKHPDPKAAFAASIREYVNANLTLDGMIREFGKVDAFIRAELARKA
ncbi:MAG TPA: glycosyltransferase family 4 protein [Rhodospirillales bacterium]|jgi:glycosyltransferase involved in cell wall biosynthesis|nr:glycosyltransferase family 4 protein [Rhodospirillales bacterium]